MASFAVNTSCQAQSTDGVLLSASVVNLGVNAKILLDDVFAAGTLNLESYFESIENPRGCYIVADGDGCRLYFDGFVPVFSTKAFKQVFLEITDDSVGPSGELYLQLDLQGAPQRLRVFGWGDPD